MTGIVYQWYGYDIYLNSTDANRLTSTASALAVASTLVPEPTASKALAVVFGASAAAISAANAGGTGVIIKIAGSFTGTLKMPFYIAAQ